MNTELKRNRQIIKLFFSSFLSRFFFYSVDFVLPFFCLVSVEQRKVFFLLNYFRTSNSLGSSRLGVFAWTAAERVCWVKNGPERVHTTNNTEIAVGENSLSSARSHEHDRLTDWLSWRENFSRHSGGDTHCLCLACLITTSPFHFHAIDFMCFRLSDSQHASLFIWCHNFPSLWALTESSVAVGTLPSSIFLIGKTFRAETALGRFYFEPQLRSISREEHAIGQVSSVFSIRVVEPRVSAQNSWSWRRQTQQRLK